MISRTERRARCGVACPQQRVDRDQELRPIVHREAPIGVGEAGGDRLERKREPLHVERGVAHRAQATPSTPAPFAELDLPLPGDGR